MSLQRNEWVPLIPPLPAQSLRFGEVVVSGFDRSGFAVYFASDILAESGSPVSTDDKLEITLPGRHSSTISGSYHESVGKWSFRIAESSRETFTDLTHALRKEQHIALCLHSDVENDRSPTGFDRWRLEPCALPDFDWQDIETIAELWGQRFAYPFLITGMTGGIAKASLINHRLASVASRYHIPMGVGSQRLALDNEAYADIFKLKNTFPNLFLLGNIGIGQLMTPNYLQDCKRACDMIAADALAIHANLLQELVQVEGDRRFAGLLPRLEKIVNHLDVPVYIKEVGNGIDVATAQKLADIGIRTLDVGGGGGTSWSKIEGLRAGDRMTQRLGSLMQELAKPTAECIHDLHNSTLPLDLIATGGIRSGLDVAKALALGAKFCGIGLPFFKAALTSEEALEEEVQFFVKSLRMTMLACGVRTLEDLPSQLRPHIGKGN